MNLKNTRSYLLPAQGCHRILWGVFKEIYEGLKKFYNFKDLKKMQQILLELISSSIRASLSMSFSFELSVRRNYF